ncbi:hypothetical protein [Paenibacillus sp. Root444D2]|uniref:hypothetical protein n=1 Tax=Paenibacillus sp. Root444D2 TaxID=1736538 RepID=UPI00070EDAE2|nr:hypothetical protein [Paenibacillus sp. Root444D2]KQX55284.1 hypothetical protein ASD40_33425 [Paenibacillus sp. Root444D2]
MKKKLLIMGLTAAVLVVGAGSAFASSKLSLKDKQVISAGGKVFDAPKGQPQDFEYKGPGAEYLDYDKLFRLLKMDAATVKEQLASGKSIVEIAESKNVPKQKIIDFFTEIAAKSQEEFNASQGIEPDPSKKEAMIKWTESAINERNIWDLVNEQAHTSLAAEKENVKPIQSVQKSEQVNEISHQEKKVYVKAEEGILKGFGAGMLNNAKLFELLQMDAAELQKELDTGKTVIEVAASKNVSEKEVNDVIIQAQVEIQLKAVENKEPGITAPPKDELAELISKKVQQVTTNK